MFLKNHFSKDMIFINKLMVFNCTMAFDFSTLRHVFNNAYKCSTKLSICVTYLSDTGHQCSPGYKSIWVRQYGGTPYWPYHLCHIVTYSFVGSCDHTVAPDILQRVVYVSVYVCSASHLVHNRPQCSQADMNIPR